MSFLTSVYKALLALGVPQFTKDSNGNFSGLKANGKNIPLPPRGPVWVPLGDSITANWWSSSLGATLTRSANVVTVSLTGHAFVTGQPVLVEQFTDASFNGWIPSITKTGTDTFTYPQVGPNGSTSAGGIRNPRWQTDIGWVTWVRMKLGNRFTMPYNAGIGGDTVANMLARFDRDVGAYSPNLVSIMAGINDINGQTSAYILGYLLQLYAKTRALNATCVAMTILPLASGHPNYSVANNEKILEVNHGIRQECKKWPNMILVDAYAAVVDPLSATGQPLSGYLSPDNIHPAPRGAEAIASEFTAKVGPFFPAGNTLISSASDNRGASASNSNLWRSLPSTTTGGSLGSGVTGSCAAVFQVTKTGTATVVASVNARTVANDGDAIGYNQRATITAAAANDGGAISPASSGWAGSAVTGNAYYLEFPINVTGVAGSNLSQLYVSIANVVDGTTITSYFLQPSGQAYPQHDFSGVIQTTPFFLNGAVSNNISWTVTAVCSAAGSAFNIDVGRVQVREIPAGSVLSY